MLVILSNFPLIYISYFPLLISAYILSKRPFNKLSIPIPASVASSPCIHEMCCNNFHTYLRSHTLHVKSEILLVALRTITLNAFATYFYFEYCVNVSLALKEKSKQNALISLLQISNTSEYWSKYKFTWYSMEFFHEGLVNTCGYLKFQPFKCSNLRGNCLCTCREFLGLSFGTENGSLHDTYPVFYLATFSLLKKSWVMLCQISLSELSSGESLSSTWERTLFEFGGITLIYVHCDWMMLFLACT